MADKVKKDTKNEKDNTQIIKPKKKLSVIVKIILIILLLLILAAVSFAGGIYLKYIDSQDLTDKWKLNEYPIIGQFFPEPKTNFEPVELGPQGQTVMPIDPNVPVVVPPEVIPPEKKPLDESELLKQAKIKQLEEAKRISKMSRLYGAMKPDEAVAILSKMDDDTVLLILSKMEDEQVAKILALFDARRAAGLSQRMLKGRSII